jgi:hypothetical protein
MATELTGRTAAAVLPATIGRQVYSQWRDRSANAGHGTLRQWIHLQNEHPHIVTARDSTAPGSRRWPHAVGLDAHDRRLPIFEGVADYSIMAGISICDIDQRPLSCGTTGYLPSFAV